MGWVVIATLRPPYLRERPGTHCTGGWVGPRAGQDWCGKSRPPTGIRFPDRLARSESLYRLSYRGPAFSHEKITKCVCYFIVILFFTTLQITG